MPTDQCCCELWPEKLLFAVMQKLITGQNTETMRPLNAQSQMEHLYHTYKAQGTSQKEEVERI